MIQKIIIDINKLNDFDRIKEIVDNYGKPIGVEYMTNGILHMIKKHMKDKVNKVIIEYPYLDSDYLSTYYLFYVKKHQKFYKESVRIHFYNISKTIDYQYFGYLTLRPTINRTTIGKTYLSPKLFLDEGDRVISNSFKIHLFGDEFYVDAFPWMQQETDIAVCAHVAIWSILRYFGRRYSNYHDTTMGNVVESLPEDVERKIPTVAVSVQKIPDIFKKLGFSPIVVSKAIVGEDIFLSEMISYIDSGLPMVGCMTEKKHAVSIIGYCSKKISNLEIDNLSKMIYNNKTTADIIVNDDNNHPYLKLRSKKLFNPFNDGETFNAKERFIEDIDYLIIPLYDRMQYNYSSLIASVEEFLKYKDLLKEGEKYVVKIYITSANSLKEHASVCINDFELRNIFLTMSMPRFVWCVDFSTIDDYRNCKMSARIIVDTTCCNKVADPWILIHNCSYVEFQDGHTWKRKEIDIDPYDSFNNLEEI